MKSINYHHFVLQKILRCFAQTALLPLPTVLRYLRGIYINFTFEHHALLSPLSFSASFIHLFAKPAWDNMQGTYYDQRETNEASHQDV